MSKSHLLTIALILLAASLSLAAQAQFSPDGVWTEISGQEASAYRDQNPALEYLIRPDKFRAFNLDKETLAEILAGAPLERLGLAPQARPEPALIYLPTPEGEYMAFEFVESPVMAPELAEQFPEIKTYSGTSLDDSSITVRFGSTPAGFRAQVLEPGKRWYIDPHYKGNTDIYVSYFKIDYTNSDEPMQCLVGGEEEGDLGDRGTLPERSGDVLRSYRIAIATTGEYAQFHGGTTEGALAAVTTTLNRVTGIYEKELAIRFTLVGSNADIIFLDPATDPFNNTNASVLIDQSQTEIDNVIGPANYDIGHTFSTGAGGLAGLGVVCTGSQKARGVTGRRQPVGDPYDVDFVAHEIGHQFGGNHTFNGAMGNCSGGNRNAGTAYEPGSGSTIQAYAGICGTDDLQPNSDALFHSESHAEMIAYAGAGGACSSITALGNAIPAADAGADYTIPLNTPFALTGSGNDSDSSDTLTYLWEQRDLGPQAALSAADDGQVPLFRVFTPSTSPTRYLPKLATLAANTSDNAEKLPQVARTMNWRLTVRDNKGGIDSDDMQVTVSNAAGPFRVTSPNGGETLGNTANVTWNVASTNTAPVSAANVNIYLSTDGGQSFPSSPLVTNTPNDGAHTVTLPSGSSNQARVMVMASNNIFFDVSNADFTYASQGGSDPTLTVIKNGSGTGTVTSAPPGINCGSECDESYTAGTMVTLTATLGAGSSFTGWSGGGCSGTGACVVTLNTSTIVTATFSSGGTEILLDGFESDASAKRRAAP